jgi:hypothetical protein
VGFAAGQQRRLQIGKIREFYKFIQRGGQEIMHGGKTENESRAGFVRVDGGGNYPAQGCFYGQALTEHFAALQQNDMQ